MDYRQMKYSVYIRRRLEESKKVCWEMGPDEGSHTDN